MSIHNLMPKRVIYQAIRDLRDICYGSDCRVLDASTGRLLYTLDQFGKPKTARDRNAMKKRHEIA